MASTKGIAVTIAILVGVVAASFLVYLIPEDTTMNIIVSDFYRYLESAKEKALIVIKSIDASYVNLMEQQVSHVEYRNVAEVSSSLVSYLCMELASGVAAR